MFTFLPTLIAVLYGRMWKVLDDEVKRIDMYHRLQKPDGATGARSLCLNYHTFWTPLCIMQAIKYRHWTVAISSIGSVLAGIVVPIFQNYVFYWEINDGALLNWPDDPYSWQVALVDETWTYRLVTALAVVWICSATLLYCLPRQSTGLTDDMKGIVGIVSLLGDEHDPSKLGLHPESSTATLLEVENMLGQPTYHMVNSTDIHGPSLKRIGTLLPSPSRFWGFLDNLFCQISTPIYKKARPIAQPCKDAFSRYSEALGKYINNAETFFPFRRAIYPIWIVLLFLVMLAVGWITASLNKNAKDAEWNYTVPIDPNVYLIVGLFVQVSTSIAPSPLSSLIANISKSIGDVIEHAVRSLAPFYALSRGYQPPEVLWADYTSGIPLWEVAVAWWHGHHLVCCAMCASVATTVFTIFLGSLQLSASAYGSTSFETDLAAATAATLLVAFVLAVHAGLGYQFSARRRRFLPRAPASVGAVVPYVFFSKGLRADLRRVRGAGNKGRAEQMRELRRLDRRYGLGEFTYDGQSYFGVERHSSEASAVRLLH